MKTISVKLTFDDDAWYEWFVAPKQAYGELPTLVMRLLRAYSDNDELAMKIDQFLDENDEPEVFSTRAAIQDALSKLGNLENSITQDLNALDGGMEEGFDEDDDDVVVTDSDGKFAYTPESVAAELGNFMGYDPSKVSDEQMDLFDDDVPANSEPIVQQTAQAAVAPNTANPIPQQAAPAQQGDSQIDKILTALGMMTGQVAQLTETVSNLVSINVNNMGTPNVAAQSQVQSTIVATDASQNNNASTTPTAEETESNEAFEFMDAALASLDL